MHARDVESTAVVDGSLDRVKIVIPDDFQMPRAGSTSASATLSSA